jgi:hypothetical protein
MYEAKLLYFTCRPELLGDTKLRRPLRLPPPQAQQPSHLAFLVLEIVHSGYMVPRLVWGHVPIMYIFTDDSNEDRLSLSVCTFGC